MKSLLFTVLVSVLLCGFANARNYGSQASREPVDIQESGRWNLDGTIDDSQVSQFDSDTSASLVSQLNDRIKLYLQDGRGPFGKSQVSLSDSDPPASLASNVGVRTKREASAQVSCRSVCYTDCSQSCRTFCHHECY